MRENQELLKIQLCITRDSFDTLLSFPRCKEREKIFFSALSSTITRKGSLDQKVRIKLLLRFGYPKGFARHPRRKKCFCHLHNEVRKDTANWVVM